MSVLPRRSSALRLLPVAVMLVAATACQYPGTTSTGSRGPTSTAARPTTTAPSTTSATVPTSTPPTSSATPTTTTTTPTTTSSSPTTVPPTSSTTPPAPRPAGRPGPANTGVPAGTKLTVVNGDQVFTRDGEVVDGKDFHGFVTVKAANVTFRNSIFRGGDPAGSNRAVVDAENAKGTLIEDSEVVAAHPAATLDGIWTNNTHLVRLNVHGGVDGVKTGSNVLVESSWIHDMQWFASDPNQGGGETHNDGVQSFDGDSNVVLRDNVIDMSGTRDANAAWQSSARDSAATGNYLDGGGCILNFAAHATPLGGISVTDNRFGPSSFYSCPILLSLRTSLSRNTGNVWDVSGLAIPAPQQHD